MAMSEYMTDVFTVNRWLYDSILALEKKRNLRLLKKLHGDHDKINFQSHLAEMKFGLFFDQFAEKLTYEKKIKYDGERYKRPDWVIDLNGQTIVTDSIRMNFYSNEANVTQMEKAHEEHKAERSENKKPGKMSMHIGEGTMENFYGHQHKLENKESQYREFLDTIKLPFIICFDPVFDTLISELDTFLFLIGERKHGLFYTNEIFARNVTGIAMKGGFGDMSFSYFPNENAQYKLNEENAKVFLKYAYQYK